MLRISSLSLHNFRSFDAFRLEEAGELTIFVGPNASGKTNALEAIRLLTAASSFRNASPTDLIGISGAEASASARIVGDGRILDVEMISSEGKRHWSLNGKKRLAKEIRGLLPSVVFTPDDLQIIKGGDRGRRREIDMLGLQINSNYNQITKDYEKLLSHKNRLLKDGASESVLDAVYDVFAIVAEQYSQYRQALFERLMPALSKQYSLLASESGKDRPEKLTGLYARSWDGPTDEALKNAKWEELGSRRTVIGPHLDKITLLLDGLDASKFASQGQQRSIMLALKLAEVETIEQMTGSVPILLLDDVMSELDAQRRSALVDIVLGGSQTFVTTANIDYFDDAMLSAAKIIELKG